MFMKGRDSMTIPDQGGWTSPTPVEPTAGKWEMVDELDAQDYRISSPPGNHSTQTEKELAELHALAANRTPADIAQILHWSTQEATLVSHWGALLDELARKYHLSPPAAGRIYSLLTQGIYTSVVACWKQKYRYLRPRPNQLDPSLNVSVIAVPQHPSYPAGHSVVGGVASMVIAHFFPAEAERAAAKAEDSGISRLKAGIHYRSDHTGGLRLGSKVAAAIIEESLKDGAPKQYIL
jgi:hypothetical protein